MTLIIAPQWIGDAVMTEPLLRRLHARGERLTVAAMPWVAPVYRAMPHVAEVIELPFQRGRLQWRERRAFAKQHLQGRFQNAYVLPNSFKSALLPWMAHIPQRIGYLGEMRFGLLTQRLPNPKNKPPMVAFYSSLSGEAGIAQDRPQLQLDRAASQIELARLGLSGQSYYVFAPGAEFGPAKRWPTVHFAELARLLAAQVVLLGSPKEAALCAQIADHAPAGSCLNLAGKTSLDQAMALIANARAVVSNDSGLMHVAAALSVSQVAVFGSSSPLHTPPLNDRAQVLWLKSDPNYQPPLDCAPCFQRECPLGHTRCLNDVTAQQVRQVLA